MAKIIVFGLPGEEGLYLADIDAGTVVSFSSPDKGALASANALRSSGATVFKGVNLAVTVASADSAFAGVFDS